MTTVVVPAGWSGYPSAAVAAAPTARPRHTSHVKLVGLLVAGLLVAVGVVSGVSALLTPSAKPVVCPPNCGHPPTGRPVESLPRFTAHDGSFSVSYYSTDSKVHTSATATSVTTTIGSGAMELFGQRADSGSAAQAVATFVAAHFPGAHRIYALPNAVVGYQPGYGEVDDYYPQNTNGTYTHERVIVVAAAKNDEVLVGAAIGPYDEFSPNGDTDGHPSGADLKIALDMDALVNSFTWRGDAPR